MKEVSTEGHHFTEDEIFTGLKEILNEVAPYKIVSEVTAEKSLVKDFAFDSIDIMGMLLKVQERYMANRPIIDVDKFVNQAYKGKEAKTVSIRTICRIISDIIN